MPFKLSKLFVVIYLLSTIGCVKLPSPKEEIPSNPVKFGNIKASPVFTWETSKQLKVFVTGLETRIPIKRSLLLSNKSGNAKYYSELHTMNETFNFNITVPINEDSMMMQFGNIKKTYGIRGATVNIDYLPPIEPDPQ